MNISFLNKRHAFMQMYKCLLIPFHPPNIYVGIKFYEYTIYSRLKGTATPKWGVN